jgi:predicted amidohydrolase YtcJ
MKKLITCVYLLIQVCIAGAQPGSSMLIFRHANVIDGLTDKTLLNVTVMVKDGKITGMEKSGKAIPANAVVIDPGGKWLMPGYIDTHVHFGRLRYKRTKPAGVKNCRNKKARLRSIELRRAEPGNHYRNRTCF